MISTRIHTATSAAASATRQVTFMISNAVARSIKSMPPSEGKAIADALAREFIFGDDPAALLTPMQMVAYRFIRFNIENDMRHAQAE